MIGFHIDMNIAQFTGAYLEKWLRRLAGLGYDAVIWEVENNVRWETCPECASPDAFAKDEFREIIALCRDLGLEPIPLLQTIAHAEYVLKHERYSHLAEIEGNIRQYCPQNPDLAPFLHRWIDEYLDLFGDVRFFHLGADEAWWMGECPKCAAYVEEHSLGDLYVEHVRALAAPLVERGVTPIVWADMVLHHNESLDKLPREIMLFDWMYDIHYGMGKFWVWGKEWFADDDIGPDVLDDFGAHLFPQGDEPGRHPETFYTADVLAEAGFRTVTCPSSSSYGDNVFAPRNWYHMINTWDSCHKGLSPHLEGSVLTSWTVHLHPWELQLASIEIPPFAAANPGASMADFQADFTMRHFGISDKRFWRACGLLSKPCLFTHTSLLGYDKAALPVSVGHAGETVAKIRKEGRIGEELANAEARLKEYEFAAAIFDELAASAQSGRELIGCWLLAAENLVNRARAAVLLLAAAEGRKGDAAGVLADMRGLQERTEALYEPIIKPARRREMMAWMFETVESALSEVAG